MVDQIFIFGAKYLYKFIAAIALFWFLRQNNSKKKDILILAVFCLPLEMIISKFASSLYYNPRPFVVGNFTPLIHHLADNGFPSHHTLLVFIITGIVLTFNRAWGSVLLFLSLFVGFSRVYTGLHHPADIFAGILISLGSVWLVDQAGRYLQSFKLRREQN